MINIDRIAQGLSTDHLFRQHCERRDDALFYDPEKPRLTTLWYHYIIALIAIDKIFWAVTMTIRVGIGQVELYVSELLSRMAHQG